VEVGLIIPVRKFGEVLISRPAGREAALIMRSSFTPDATEEVALDFEGVKVVAPSWLDEVLTGLREAFGDRVRCLPSANPTLVESLKTLEESSA
jgi:hypothetical protein